MFLELRLEWISRTPTSALSGSIEKATPGEVALRDICKGRVSKEKFLKLWGSENGSTKAKKPCLSGTFPKALKYFGCAFEGTFSRMITTDMHTFIVGDPRVASCTRFVHNFPLVCNIHAVMTLWRCSGKLPLSFPGKCPNLSRRHWHRGS